MIASVLSRRFVAREAELEQLHQWRRAAANGHATLILIEGEAGIGKSRLLWEFTRGLTGGRAPLLVQAECLERAPRPLGPFRNIISAITVAAPWLTAAVTPLARRVLQQLRPYHGDDAGDGLQRLEKADLLAGIHELFATAARKRATVLTIEDLQWADAATLELLEYLAPRIGTMRLAIVTTLRNDMVLPQSPLARALGQLEREASVHELRLLPLGQPAIRRLLESAAESHGTVDDAALRDIVARSEGNPLCAEELLKSWLDGAHRHELPRSLKALIAERVARLTVRERRILMHAAVLGQGFDAEFLAQILGCRLSALVPALQHAIELTLIVEDAKRLGGFRFRHALTRQALYESQLALTRRPLHARIARALEARPDAGHHLDELANHWWEAAHAERARYYNERAGFAALDVCAYADASVYLERALSLCADPLERARLMETLGTTHRSDGNSVETVRWCLNAATAFADADKPNEAVAPLLCGCAELGNANRLDDARTELERFDARYGDRLVPSARARLRCNISLFQANRLDMAVPSAALADPDRDLGAGENDARLRYWAARMVAHAQFGELGAWRRAAGEARSILDVDARTPLFDRISTYCFIGLTGLQLAQHDEVRRALARARDLAETQALRPSMAYLEALHATDAYLTGRLHEAREAALFAAEHARFVTTRAVLGCAGPPIGLALADKMLVESTVFGDAADAVLAHGLQSQSDLACGSVAAAWLASGRKQDARKLLEAAVAGMTGVVHGQFIWPLAAHHVGTTWLNRLVDVLDRTKANPEHHVAHAVAAHVGAIAALRTGNSSNRIQLAGEAAERYRSLGWPLFEAQALELLDRREAAHAVYERCGSVADLRRLALKNQPSARVRGQRSGDRLSRREREIVALVADAFPNRAVADRLGITEKTVQSHLTTIFRKLGFRSRAELAAHYGRAPQGSPDRRRRGRATTES